MSNGYFIKKESVYLSYYHLPNNQIQGNYEGEFLVNKFYSILIYILAVGIGIGIFNLQKNNIKYKPLTKVDTNATIDTVDIEIIRKIEDFRTQPKPTPTPEAVITVMMVEESKDEVPEYDIPLDKELQKFTYEKCKEYGVPYELVLAVMQTESEFKTNAVNKNSNKTKDHGIMQINSIHVETFKEKGFTDIFDPYQNIEYGISYLAELYHKFDGDEHATATAYNRGERGYKRLVSRGITTTKYSRKVLANKESLQNKNIKEGE